MGFRIKGLPRQAFAHLADVVPGPDLAALIERMFADPGTAYLHAHYAKRGCYAARIDRAG